jgi:hypothetical protein
MSLAARLGQVGWCALLLCCGRGAFAAEPAKPGSPAPASAADAEFLEYLGAEDVEDEDWRDFLDTARQPQSEAKPAASRSDDEGDEHE